MASGSPIQVEDQAAFDKRKQSSEATVEQKSMSQTESHLPIQMFDQQLQTDQEQLRSQAQLVMQQEIKQGYQNHPNGQKSQLQLDKGVMNEEQLYDQKLRQSRRATHHDQKQQTSLSPPKYDPNNSQDQNSILRDSMRRDTLQNSKASKISKIDKFQGSKKNHEFETTAGTKNINDPTMDQMNQVNGQLDVGNRQSSLDPPIITSDLVTAEENARARARRTQFRRAQTIAKVKIIDRDKIPNTDRTRGKSVLTKGGLQDNSTGSLRRSRSKPHQWSTASLTENNKANKEKQNQAKDINMYANYPKVKDLPKNRGLKRGATLNPKAIKKLTKANTKGEEDLVKGMKGGPGKGSPGKKRRKRLDASPNKSESSLHGAIRPPENHDWKETPLYRQFVLKQSEYESLKETELVQDILKVLLEERKQRGKEAKSKEKEDHKGALPLKKLKTKGKKEMDDASSRMRDFDGDREELLKEAVEKALQDMLKETEISYVIDILKRKDENKANDILKLPTQKQYFQKAKKTLEILMAKMGLTVVYKKLMYHYEQNLKDHFEETLLKVLYRCLIGHRSIQKCQKIFSLNSKKQDILKDLGMAQAQEGYQEDGESTDKQEQIVAKLCLQSSRLYVQVTQFLDESNFYRGQKFIYEGANIQRTLRDEIKQLREANETKFKKEVPLMDRYGRLVYSRGKGLLQKAEELVGNNNSQQARNTREERGPGRDERNSSYDDSYYDSENTDHEAY